jgi:hypothetical protein
MKKLILAVLLGASTIPTLPASALPCVDWSTRPPTPDFDCGNGYRATGAVEFAGFVSLPTFPCVGSGCTANFSSTVAAGLLVGPSTGALVVTNLSAGFTYQEACAGGQALEGSAAGVATLSGIGTPMSAGFTWGRVGLVAAISGGGIAGAAVFVPTTGLPVCTVPSSLDAAVAGAFVSASA